MIEKYLNDTIVTERKPLEDRITKTFLIPARMLAEMKRLDSLQQVKSAEQLARETLEEAADTLQNRDIPAEEMLLPWPPTNDHSGIAFR